MRTVKLSDISERIDYGLTASASSNPVGPRFLRITDIVDDTFDLKSVPYVDTSEEIAHKYALVPGDIVIARTGATTGASLWFNDDEEPVTFASYLVRFRIRNDQNSRFIGYVLKSDTWKNYVNAEAHSKSAQPNMSAALMAEFRLVLPPRREQDAIAEVLGALDDKIAANSRVIRESTGLQEAIWKQRTKGLPLEPLTRFAGIHLGGTPSRTKEDAWGPGVAWASVKDITAAPSGLLVETTESITEEASLSAPRLNALPTGTTLLTARGTVGVVATNVIPCAINQSAYALLPKNVSHVSLRLAVESLAASFRSRAHGSVFSTITMSTLEESLIPDITAEAVTGADTILESLEKQRTAVQLENIALARTRDELLPLLMSGRMKVRDAQARVEEVAL